jgi:hypothetical protein
MRRIAGFLSLAMVFITVLSAQAAKADHDDRRDRGYWTCTANDRGWEEHRGGHSMSGYNRRELESVALRECLRYHGECTVSCERETDSEPNPRPRPSGRACTIPSGYSTYECGDAGERVPSGDRCTVSDSPNGTDNERTFYCSNGTWR